MTFSKYSMNNFDDNVNNPVLKIVEYNIIKAFKDILDRQPTDEEMKNMKVKIGDNTDYSVTVNELSKHPENKKKYTSSIENFYDKNDSIDILSDIYFKEFNKQIPVSMLLVLNNIYKFFNSDKYMIKALLLHNNYINFENYIVKNNITDREIIMDLIQENFKYDELKLKANDIYKYDMINKDVKDNDIESSNNVNNSLLPIEKFTSRDSSHILNNIYNFSTKLDDLNKNKK
jgi:hypothetical protein